MNIKKFTESINPHNVYEEKVLLDAIKEILEPWKEQLKFRQTQLAAGGTNAVFSLINGIDESTSNDFIDIFNILNKFGLKWYLDYTTIIALGWNTICIIVYLNEYNDDEMGALINSKKYNL